MRFRGTGAALLGVVLAWLSLGPGPSRAQAPVRVLFQKAPYPGPGELKPIQCLELPLH